MNSIENSQLEAVQILKIAHRFLRTDLPISCSTRTIFEIRDNLIAAFPSISPNPLMLLSSHPAAILTGPILTGLLQTGDASIEPMHTCKAALPHISL
jgi:hypothetical protein